MPSKRNRPHNEPLDAVSIDNAADAIEAKLRVADIRNITGDPVIHQLHEITGLKQDDCHQVINAMVQRGQIRVSQGSRGLIDFLTFTKKRAEHWAAIARTEARQKGGGRPDNPPAETAMATSAAARPAGTPESANPPTEDLDMTAQSSHTHLSEARQQMVRLVAGNGVKTSAGYRLARPQGETSLARWIAERCRTKTGSIDMRFTAMERDGQLKRIKGTDGLSLEGVEIPTKIVRAVMGDEFVDGPTDEVAQDGAPAGGQDPPADVPATVAQGADDTPDPDQGHAAEGQDGLSNQGPEAAAQEEPGTQAIPPDQTPAPIDYDRVARSLLQQAVEAITEGTGSQELAKEVEQLRAEADMLRGQRDRQAHADERNRETLEALKGQLQSLTADRDELRESRTSLIEEAKGKNAQIAQLTATIEARDTQMADLTADRDQLRAGIAELIAAAQSTDADIDRLTRTIETTRQLSAEKIQGKEARIAHLEAELAARSQELDTASRTASQREHEALDLRVELARLDRERPDPDENTRKVVGGAIASIT